MEKYAGREMAITASKVYALEINRKSQSPFIMFNGQKKHEDEPIKQAQEFIENNIFRLNKLYPFSLVLVAIFFENF